MASIDEQILRTTKEIIVKFIELGRISPTGFDESFRSVYQTVSETVPREPKKRDSGEGSGKKKKKKGKH